MILFPIHNVQRTTIFLDLDKINVSYKIQSLFYLFSFCSRHSWFSALSHVNDVAFTAAS